jgi:hypothetical protein
MKRRELLAKIPMMLLAVPVLGAAGCLTDDDDEYPLRPPGGGGGTSEGPGGGADSFVGRNQDESGHQHTVEIRCASLEAGRTTYVAEGPHQHTLTLSDGDIDDLLAGRSVTVTTTALHEHTWVLSMPDGLC